VTWADSGGVAGLEVRHHVDGVGVQLRTEEVPLPRRGTCETAAGRLVGDGRGEDEEATVHRHHGAGETRVLGRGEERA
jgi:hypothetical protein